MAMQTTAKNLSKILLFTTLLLCSCNDAFHEFRSLEGCCWDINDTLLYSYNRPFSWDGEYEARVELRCTQKYPYKDLWIEIKGENSRKEQLFNDTLHCNIYDNNGRMNGFTTGMLYQMGFTLPYVIPLTNDTVNIYIRHLMSDEVLPGVSDVGLRLSYIYRNQSSKN